jgi:hypothetical protein
MNNTTRLVVEAGMNNVGSAINYVFLFLIIGAILGGMMYGIAYYSDN